MSFLRLSPGVGYCLVGERAIFLDTRRDRYLALDGEAETAFAQARQSAHALHPDDPATGRLLATDLFVLAEEPRPLAPPTLDIPPRGLSRESLRPQLRPLDVAEIWLLLRSARRGLAAGRLDRLLAALDRRRRGLAAAPCGSKVEALASRFLKARALIPIRPVCLQDSLALATWLARRSVRPTLVFGVRLDPFGAHCWVQTGSAILNDAPDKVAEFTPILVIS